VRKIKNIFIILHNLSSVAFDLESEPSTSEAPPTQASFLKNHHLHGRQQVLRRLEKGLTNAQRDFESSLGLKKVQRRLKWPFSSTETEEIFKELQLRKQTINIALC